jgi:serine/threonine protein kinase
MIIANKYEILNKLNEGAFGSVFKGKHIRTGELVAIKMESKSAINTLRNEAKIYQYLKNQYGFPQLKWYGTNVEYNYLVIDLLGCSLTKLTQSNICLNHQKIILICIQIIKRIETLHNKLLLHRDIKPDNILFDSNNTLNLIDFGLCKRYEYDGKHIEEKHGLKLIGTANFVSINVHKGIEPSRRDDLESCIYILLYMCWQGELHWNTNIIQNKEQLVTDESVPTFIKDMLTYVHNLGFDQTPNYEYLINILNKSN